MSKHPSHRTVLHHWAAGDWQVEAVVYSDRLHLLYQVEILWTPEGGRRVSYQAVKPDNLEAKWREACREAAVEIAKLALSPFVVKELREI